MSDESSSSFSMENALQEKKSLSYLPDCYVVPSSHGASLATQSANIPIIDLAKLRQVGNDKQRSSVIKELSEACRHVGFFQIVNHGICQSILDDALSAGGEFFESPAEEMMKFMSSDVHKPVRCGTSLTGGAEKIQFWRVFLKHYAHPLENWIDSWPKNPPGYREKMGKYSSEARKLALELMEAVTESLGLGPKYLGEKLEEGMQVVAVNCYPPCPQPEVALGLPPHSDYSCLTILLQSSPGLEILDLEDGKWKAIPDLRGALQVHVGDHLEVLSNGEYKSVLHRATLNCERTRVSIASLHSLGMDEKVGTAKELVDEQNPVKYRESSFRDFLNFLCTNDISEGKSFISTLKIKKMDGCS